MEPVRDEPHFSGRRWVGPKSGTLSSCVTAIARSAGTRGAAGTLTLSAAGRERIAPDGRGGALFGRRRSLARRFSISSVPKRRRDPLAELETAREHARVGEVGLEVARHRAGRRVALLAIRRERASHDRARAPRGSGSALVGQRRDLGAARLLEQRDRPRFGL